jgi:hypothetical protein
VAPTLGVFLLNLARPANARRALFLVAAIGAAGTACRKKTLNCAAYHIVLDESGLFHHRLNDSTEFAEEDILSSHKMGLLLAVCIGAAFASAQTGSAAPDTNPIGKVLAATGTIRIDHPVAITVPANLPPNNVAQAKVGDFIYRGDIIQTGPDGNLGVGFADGSSFSVSPNARMEVNEFVYDPHGHLNSSLMSLTKGTFTFIAGEVAQTGNMKVTTPVGTMGIRGTAPRVEILNDRSVKFSTTIEEK